ncbi:MAG: family 16 glycosylhydrolase, partial [Bacteroidales bacterium]|nr:family 16 glycosylhydrolase [Bacteroidales bacterium]
MKKYSLCTLLILVAGQIYAQEAKFHSAFTEDFSKETSEFFNYNYRQSGYDSRYYSGIRSFTEAGTDIMLYRIDPADPAGAGRGPEIISKDYTFYGSYSARLKVPNAREAQPNIGAVVGYFTYNVEPKSGLSEIDFEWLLADPRIIYIGTWTGKGGSLNR